MKSLRLYVLVFVLTADVIACGPSGEDGDQNGLTGVSFTQSNAADLGGIAVSAIEVFPIVSSAYQAIVDAIEMQNPVDASSSTKSLADLGDIGLCSSGQSNLRWNDSDDDGVLSAGDTTALEWVDCNDEITGTLGFSFLAVAYALTVADVDLAVTVDNGLDAQSPPLVLEGRFRGEINGIPGTPDTPESAIARYLVVDQTDPSLGLTTEADGQGQYALGCFNLYFTIELERGSYTLAEPFGVFGLPDSRIMTMRAFALPPLDFENGDYPTSGAIGLFAESGATPCTALGVGPEGVDSNGSFTTVTATTGGDVVLEGETPSGTPFTVETTWVELRR